MAGDKFAWFRDVEFARQTLAGLNPYSIRLVKVCNFDKKIYLHRLFTSIHIVYANWLPYVIALIFILIMVETF